MNKNYIANLFYPHNEDIHSSMLVLIIQDALRGYTEHDLNYAKYINQAGFISGSTLIG